MPTTHKRVKSGRRPQRTAAKRPAKKTARPSSSSPRRNGRGILYFWTKDIRDKAWKILRDAGVTGLERGQDFRLKAEGKPYFVVMSNARADWMEELLLHPRTAANGRKRKQRRNGDDDDAAAAAMYEKFHGKPANKVTEYTITDDVPGALADCGRLLQLKVRVLGQANKTVELNDFGACRVTTTPDGGQLYFVGGKQDLDLRALGLSSQLPKDHLTIGPVVKIWYFTRKGFHDFEPTNYHHKFGENGGWCPDLCYDVRNKRMYLTGGSYQVKRPGIIN